MFQEATNALERVDDLWFPDANLILRAENQLFRIYSGVLGARSSVFRDMVAFPQPAHPEGDIMDGIPIVRLHDSAGEVEVFLRAVFDSSFFMPPPSPIDFDTVIGIMRLAHKYDVQYLFRRALSHLESMYPTDFPEFFSAHNYGMHHINIPSKLAAALISIRTASEVGALWLLPAAYYTACTFASKHLLASEGPWTSLSAHEQQTCLTSQVELVRGTASTHDFVAKLPNQSCIENCSDVVDDARDELSTWRILRCDLDPLGSWVFSDTAYVLCSQCSSIGQAKFDAAQLEFWNRLPATFGLASWAELKEMRRAVMEETI